MHYWWKKNQIFKAKKWSKKLIGEENVIYVVKARSIFDTFVKKAIKRKSEEDPEEEIKELNNNNISINYKHNANPSFNNVRASIYRYINKNIQRI